MIRYIAPLALVTALATTAHAQNYVTQSYTTTDAYGNSITSTTQAPGSAVGLIANQGIYGGTTSFGAGITYGGSFSYGGGISYGGGVPTYGANCPPSYYGGYAGYPTYPSYGGNNYYYNNNNYYGNNGYGNNCPPAIPYFPPVAPPIYSASNYNTPRTYIPGQRNQPIGPGVIYNSMAIGTNPQPASPVGNAPAYNYGWRANGRRR